MKTTGNPQPDWKPESKWAVEEDWREKRAKEIDWTDVAEKRIRNFTLEEKAEIARDMSDATLAAMFNNMVNIMCWNPQVAFMQPVKESLAIENAMLTLRTEQADLARQEFLDTGIEP